MVADRSDCLFIFSRMVYAKKDGFCFVREEGHGITLSRDSSFYAIGIF